MLHTFSVQSNEGLNEESPWKGILSAIAFGVRATLHTTTQATPMQLVFGRDAIINLTHKANWCYIRDRKLRIIKLNNEKENAKRFPYNYKPNDLVLVKAEHKTKFGTDTYLGPFTVLSVNDNGTVRVDKGIIQDTYNVRNLTSYV